MKLPTETEITKQFDKYLKDCIKDNKLPTKNGVCILFDITRETYNRWKKKSDALKAVENLIEEAWVQRLNHNNVAGIIFYLKNAFQYRDNKGLDLTTKGKELNYTNDQIQAIAKRTLKDDTGKGK